MKLTVKTAVVGAVIASTAVLAAPGAATAAPSDVCAVGKICLFDGHNLTGDVLQIEPGKNIDNLGLAWNDRASSMWNRSDDFVCINSDANQLGLWYTVLPPIPERGITGKQELLYLWENALSSLEFGGCGDI